MSLFFGIDIFREINQFITDKRWSWMDHFLIPTEISVHRNPKVGHGHLPLITLE